MTVPREIKFRAWDIGSKKMLDVFAVNPMNRTAYISHQQRWGEPGDDILVKYSSNTFGEQDIYLMQFTGLLDKNGKEIYEGDIFNCLYHFDGCTEHKVVIEWSKDAAAFYPRRMGECQQMAVQFHIWDFERMEIIGNIYDNSELLSLEEKQ